MTFFLCPRCDECVDRFWNIDENCLPCAAHCDPVGTEADSVCDKDSGQCVCKTNVQGNRIRILFISKSAPRSDNNEMLCS